MKFSELHNPKAASKLIQDFRKKFSTKVCLAPKITSCSGAIISAHTISAEAGLRPIAKDGHVYTPNLNVFDPDRKIEFKLNGIKETSTFNGFCAFHDKTLFSPIEDQAFICSPEQIFLHAYRAVSKESYLKNKQAEGLPTVKEFKKIHGIPDEEEYFYTPQALQFLEGSMRGAEDVSRLKLKFDEYLTTSQWKRLETTVIPFEKTPSLVCSYMYAPDFDFQGNYLQDFEDYEQDLDPLFVTIVPSGSRGYALLSHLDTARTAPRRLISSLLNQNNLSTALFWIVLSTSENIAIAPDWYESLGKDQREFISSHFHSNVQMRNPVVNILRDCPDFIVEWNAQASFNL